MSNDNENVRIEKVVCAFRAETQCLVRSLLRKLYRERDSVLILKLIASGWKPPRGYMAKFFDHIDELRYGDAYIDAGGKGGDIDPRI